MGNDSIEVQRRRKGEGPVGRAEAPRRETGGGPSGGQGGGGFPSFGGMPSRGGRIGGCGTIVVILLLIGYFLLSGGGGLDLGGSTDQGTGLDPPAAQPVQPESQGLPESNFTPPAPASTGNQTWTVMLYQDADDQVLEQDIFLDLNEAERVGSSQNVNIVTQIDRYRGAFQGDGDWTSARRYYVTQDSDLNHINSQLVQDLGEVEMSDGQTLADFVQWAAQNYPADHYVLILSDHGMGWPGALSDQAPGGSDSSGLPITSRLGKNLYTMELDAALQQALGQAGIDKFDIVGMDACLMSQIEVMAALQPYANYAVASEEVEPAIGWAYAAFLGALVQNPDMSPADLSRLIVQSYVIDDQRILDPAARADFMRGGSPMGAFFGTSTISADQLSAQIGRDVTLSAIDLTALPDLMQSFNTFAYQLQNDSQDLVAQARQYSQSYTSLFGRQVPPSYIDLGNFVLLMQANTQEGSTKQAADSVIASLKKVVLAEKHGASRKGSTGLAIYFPNSTLYSSPVAGPQSYTGVARRFADESLWDDFLAFHYLDRNFDTTSVQPYVPSGSYATRAPGAGGITLANLQASTTSIDPTNNETVGLSVDVSGSNIGYMKLFVGYFDAASNSLNVTDTDYLESPETRQTGGVYYPAWPQGDFSMNFTWDGTVFGISDGTQNAVALLQPVQYGASADEAEYAVEGMYTFAETGEQRYAQLHLQNGKLTQVVGFTGASDSGAPHEITPAPGDSFTIYEKWMDVDANGNVTGTVSQAGTTLTFGNQPFTWVQLYAAQGNYVVGFIAEDLDGNPYPIYTQITVR
ncbi:MAG: clostripain-related cysteine peptidase [Anaerolineales bacterium]